MGPLPGHGVRTVRAHRRAARPRDAAAPGGGRRRRRRRSAAGDRRSGAGVQLRGMGPLSAYGAPCATRWHGCSTRTPSCCCSCGDAGSGGCSTSCRCAAPPVRAAGRVTRRRRRTLPRGRPRAGCGPTRRSRRGTSCRRCLLRRPCHRSRACRRRWTRRRIRPPGSTLRHWSSSPRTAPYGRFALLAEALARGPRTAASGSRADAGAGCRADGGRRPARGPCSPHASAAATGRGPAALDARGAGLAVRRDDGPGGVRRGVAAGAGRTSPARGRSSPPRGRRVRVRGCVPPDNRWTVVGSDAQLRYGPDGRWWPYAKERGRWVPAGPAEDDPAAALAGACPDPERQLSGCVRSLPGEEPYSGAARVVP